MWARQLALTHPYKGRSQWARRNALIKPLFNVFLSSLLCFSRFLVKFFIDCSILPFFTEEPPRLPNKEILMSANVGVRSNFDVFMMFGLFSGGCGRPQRRNLENKETDQEFGTCKGVNFFSFLVLEYISSLTDRLAIYSNVSCFV